MKNLIILHLYIVCQKASRAQWRSTFETIFLVIFLSIRYARGEYGKSHVGSLILTRHFKSANVIINKIKY